MKILYVINMYPSELYIYKGIHVKEQIDYLTSNYNFKHTIYYIDGGNSKLNYLKSILHINRLIKKNNFDLIHIHFGLSGLFLLFNPFIQIPALVTIHGSDIGSSKAGGLIRYITKTVIKRVDVAIVLNDKMITSLPKQKHKLVKIPCGINISQFNVGRNNNHRTFLIGFPADKTRKEKNYNLFEKIIIALRNSGYNISTIEFHNLTRIQVIDALSKLDCLLMTSHREGSPQIIKEAMACEVPIISSNVGDVETLLHEVKNCYVINSFLAEEFAEKLIQLIKLKPEDRITNGKQKIKSLGLDQESVSSKIFQLYKGMVEKVTHQIDNV